MMKPYYFEPNITIYNSDVLSALKDIPDESVDCVVTSPPYWGLRDYGVEGQLGLEQTLEEYLKKLLIITKELKRALKKSGVMFWNHGDCYGGIKSGKTDKKVSDYVKESQEGLKKYAPKSEKCLMLQNWRLIIKMIDEYGWILRNTIIWNKPNHMPSSVKDRFANSYEPVFMLVKNKKYWFDLDVVRVPVKYPEDVARRIRQDKEAGVKPFEKRTDIARHTKKQKFITPEQSEETQEKTGWQEGSGRVRSFFDNFGGKSNPLGKNPGDVWTIPTQPIKCAHFACFAEKLVEPMIKAGCPVNGIVLDPFAGSGTVGVVAKRLNRQFIGIDLKKDYCDMAIKRIQNTQKDMFL